jgi:hypothetical protein
VAGDVYQRRAPSSSSRFRAAASIAGEYLTERRSRQTCPGAGVASLVGARIASPARSSALAGDKGDTGDAGVPATKYWARVVTFFSGDIFSSTGTVTVTWAATAGEYTVAYPQAVNDCSTIVSVNRGINGGFGAQVVIPSVSYGSDNNHTNISFSDAAGTLTRPLGFNVATFC